MITAKNTSRPSTCITSGFHAKPEVHRAVIKASITQPATSSIAAALMAMAPSEVRSHFKDKVFETQVPRSIRLAEAPSFGQPVILYDIRSKGAEAYLQLARELMNHGQLALFTP